MDPCALPLEVAKEIRRAREEPKTLSNLDNIITLPSRCHMLLNVISVQRYADLLINPQPWLFTSMLRRINMPLQSHLLHD